LGPIEFHEVTADNALLQILPAQKETKERKPRSFWIHRLTLRSVRQGEPAYFRAQLTNEIPGAEIDRVRSGLGTPISQA
jgi:hypothetical protein